MKNLNELRAKDLAAAEDGSDLEDAQDNLPPDKEIQEAIEEAMALDSMLQDLDSYYGTSEYTRLGCLSHKVSYI